MGTKLFWSEREARVDSDIAVSKFEINDIIMFIFKLIPMRRYKSSNSPCYGLNSTPTNGPGDRVSISGRHTKDSKNDTWYSLA